MGERTDDVPFIEALAAVTDSMWAALWSACDAVAAEREHATWRGGQALDTVVDGDEQSVIQMPYPVYSPALARVRRWCDDERSVV